MIKSKTVLCVEYDDLTLKYFFDYAYGKILHDSFFKIAVSDEPPSTYTGLFETPEHWYPGFLYSTWQTINNEKIEVYVLELCPYLISWRVDAAYLRFDKFLKWYN